jgi:hypothetical protein
MWRRKSILLTMAALLMLIAARGAEAQTTEIIETVRYACIISPSSWGSVEGQWVTHCDGTRTGWGWEPGSNCTVTEVTSGNTCPSGGGGGGGVGDGPDNRN